MDGIKRNGWTEWIGISGRNGAEYAISFSYLERPTGYDEGPFAEVIKALLNILELPSKDPSRAIVKAIKSLK